MVRVRVEVRRAGGYHGEIADRGEAGRASERQGNARQGDAEMVFSQLYHSVALMWTPVLEPESLDGGEGVVVVVVCGSIGGGNI